MSEKRFKVRELLAGQTRRYEVEDRLTGRLVTATGDKRKALEVAGWRNLSHDVAQAPGR